MTTDLFIANLTKRFPKMEPESLMDIRGFLDIVAEDDRSRLWRDFLDTYEAGYAPKRANFVKMAERLKIPTIHEGKKYMYVCYVCTAKLGRCFKYPLDRQKCPQCGNHERPFYAIIEAFRDTPVEYARKLMEGYSTIQGEYQVVADQRLPYKD